ncbi:MAG: amidohydrolase family protein [Ignavibacteria bacterium]|nr:amidohydrolase family protein [Ignavibacteria bacterium]
MKGSVMRKNLDCKDVKGISDLMNRLNEFRMKNSFPWIIGVNLNINVLGDINGDDLCDDIPMILINYDYHSALCNISALKSSGIYQRLGEFSEDEIELKNRLPTGLIREKALNYVVSKIPEPDTEHKLDALKDCIKHMHSLGITSVSDITLPEDLEVFSKAYERGMLNLRIASYLPVNTFRDFNQLRKITENIPEDFFSIKGFKGFWDGALGSETALFSVNYRFKNHNGYRTETVKSGELQETARLIDKEGMQIKIHAIGDLAVKETLDLYSSLPGTKKLRHRIEHSQHIREEDYPRFAETGVIASVQPVHLKYDIEAVKSKLPAEIQKFTHNYRLLVDYGAILCFGTDFPIAELNPFENIRLAVTRYNFYPEYSFTLDEALKCYTINNAYANHNENNLGSISKGKVADFIIPEDNIFEMKPEELADVKVSETYLGGVKVYP